MLIVLLDEFLKQDTDSKVAIEVFGCQGVIIIGGEVTTKGWVDIPKIVRQVYQEIGYENHIGVQVNINSQSPEIKEKANKGAGDSGIVIGYATNETPEMLPLEVVLAKKICDLLEEMNQLKPDGKVQVSIEDEKIMNLVIAYQASKEVNQIIKKKVNEKFKKYLTKKTKWNLIPFKKGGFEADTGLTGRKNVLWYGPRVPTGGGSFEGKDSTKVDRSGAYFARQIANRFLRTHKKKEVGVEIAYVIGKNNPLYIKINGEEMKESMVKEFGVSNIIKGLDLKKPIYKQTSMLGHFGDKEFNWEK